MNSGYNRPVTRQKIISAAAVLLVLIGVWASSGDPSPPPAAVAPGTLPAAVAVIFTATPLPTLTAGPVLIAPTPEATATSLVTLAPPAPSATNAPPPTLIPSPAEPGASSPQPPTPQPQIAAPAPPGDPSVAGAEQNVIDQVNYQRAVVGLPPYTRDETLMQIARARVADMVARGYFGHADPVTGENLARSQAQHAGFTRAGENILRSGGPLADLPANAVAWFMGDAPHRDNLLHPAYTSIGAGIAADGAYWILSLCFGA